MTIRPKVFFIHGMWSQPSVWGGWSQLYQQAGYEVALITLPGHHAQANSHSVAGLGVDDYLQTIEQAILGYERPILVGHSMGGLLIQMVAARRAVRAAILVNSAAPAPVFPLRPIMIPGLVRHFLKPWLYGSEFKLAQWEANYLLFNAVPVEQRLKLVSGLVPESGRVVFQLGFGPLNLMRTNHVRSDDIQMPMLLLSGVLDRIIPISVSRSMAHYYERNRGFVYKEYPIHGHWMLSEPGWEQVVKDSLNWLVDLND